MKAAVWVMLGLSSVCMHASYAQEKVKLQTDWIASGEHAAYYGGWEKGIFMEEGIDITVVRGYGSGDTVAKVGANSADFGVADLATVMEGRFKANIPVQSISPLYTHSPHSLFVLKSSGITNFSGLEGKKIGVTPGNSHKVFFPQVARKSGTDETKLRWVNMDGSAMATQLLAKNIDAAPFYSLHYYYQNKAAQKMGEEIVALPFSKEGFEIYAASLIASDEMIQKKPELVAKFLKATHRAFEWAKNNPEEACTLHIKKVPEVAMDDCVNSVKATMTFVFNDFQAKVGLGKFDKERLARTWAAVSEAQSLDTTWNPTLAVYQRAINP